MEVWLCKVEEDERGYGGLVVEFSFLQKHIFLGRRKVREKCEVGGIILQKKPFFK